MKNLVDVFNTNDLRYLLNVEVLPEQYPTEELVPIFDDILKEYEKLRGDRFYSNFLEETDYGIKQASKITVLSGCYELILCGRRQDAIDLLKQLKIKADTLKAVDFEMTRIIQQMQVQAMKESDKPKEKQSFGAMCANINVQLNIDAKNATVAEFIQYENIIKQKIAAQKNG
jgi:hypothetical protein